MILWCVCAVDSAWGFSTTTIIIIFPPPPPPTTTTTTTTRISTTMHNHFRLLLQHLSFCYLSPLIGMNGGPIVLRKHLTQTTLSQMINTQIKSLQMTFESVMKHFHRLGIPWSNASNHFIPTLFQLLRPFPVFAS